MIVTTPQAVALIDAMKSLSFTRTVNLPVLGLIENMSGYVCPCCGEVSNLFSSGGGEEMARREGLVFLGRLPVETELVTLLDAAEDAAQNDGTENQEDFELLLRYQRTSSAQLFKDISDRILETLAMRIQPTTAEVK